MDPSRALRQIAFQLERAGAPTYRVQAFRRAAAVLAALPAGELVRRIADGTLEDLRGIGPATATAIAQAAAGERPEYLVRLEAEYQPPPHTAMRAALRGDCHAHSDWSQLAYCGRGRDAVYPYSAWSDRTSFDRPRYRLDLYNGGCGTGLGTAADRLPVGAFWGSDLSHPRL